MESSEGLAKMFELDRGKIESDGRSEVAGRSNSTYADGAGLSKNDIGRRHCALEGRVSNAILTK